MRSANTRDDRPPDSPPPNDGDACEGLSSLVAKRKRASDLPTLPLLPHNITQHHAMLPPDWVKF